MYKPKYSEMYNYNDYKEYLKTIIKNIKKDNEKDKKEITKNLELYKNNPVNVFSVSNDGVHSKMVIEKNPDYFIEAVGLSHKVYLRNIQYKELLDELEYLETDKGKNDYINKKGRYSNTVLLWENQIKQNVHWNSCIFIGQDLEKINLSLGFVKSIKL